VDAFLHFEDATRFVTGAEVKQNTPWTSENFALKYLERLPVGMALLKEDTDELVYLNRAGREILDIPFNKADTEELHFFELLFTEELDNGDLAREHLSQEKYLVSTCYSKRLGKKLLLKTMLYAWKQGFCRRVLLLDLTTVGGLHKQIENGKFIENTLLECLESMTLLSGKKLIKDLIEKLGTFFAADMAYILKFDHDLATSLMLYEWCGTSGPVVDKQLYNLEVGSGVYEKLSGSGNVPLMISALEDAKESLPEIYAWCQKRQVTNLYWMPYRAEGRLQGYLCLDNIRNNEVHLPLMRIFTSLIFTQLVLLDNKSEYEYEKYHDWLTGLLNRRALIQNLENYPDFNGRMGILVARLNDVDLLSYRLGNCYVANLLRNIANIFKVGFPDAVIYCRKENQLVVVSKGSNFDQFFTQTQALLAEVEGIYKEGLSLGMAWNEQGACKVEMLLYLATLRMKSNIRQSLENNQPGKAVVKEKVLGELAAGRYKLVLQEQVNLQTGKVGGAEALVRYVDEEGNLVLPDPFIGQYELEGTIHYLDLYMLRKVCYMISSWQERGLKKLPVALNISAQTLLQPGIVGEICSVVDSYTLPHNYIILEIAEDALSFTREKFVANCNRLTALGFKLCLDNFGSQFAPIKILHLITFYAVKFDGSFIHQLATDKLAAMACKTLMQFCRKLGLKVVGEEVETTAQAEILQRFKCNLGQGSYWGKPLETEEFERQIF